MARFRCVSCAGEYSDVDRRGLIYFHACPPDRVVVDPGPPPRERRETIPNPRDENIIRPARTDTGPRQPKRPGGGRVVV